MSLVDSSQVTRASLALSCRALVLLLCRGCRLRGSLLFLFLPLERRAGVVDLHLTHQLTSDNGSLAASGSHWDYLLHFGTYSGSSLMLNLGTDRGRAPLGPNHF